MKIKAEIIEALRHATSVAIMGHKNGDGDSFGSACALKLGLEKIGKNVEILAENGLPDSLSFFYNFLQPNFQNKYISADILVILDSSELKITSLPSVVEEYRSKNTPIISLDHHVPGGMEKYADLSFIDQKSCSTCEIVYTVLKQLDVNIDKKIATLLLTGIETDTLSFQNQNTTKECFSVASDLMSKGARINTIVRENFNNYSFAELKLWGLAIDRLVFNKKYQAAITYLSYKDAQKLGITEEEFSGVVNFLNSIKGAKLVVLLKEEKPGIINVSLRTRSDEVDVQKIAKEFGGGGHKKASGFTVSGEIVAEKGLIYVK